MLIGITGKAGVGKSFFAEKLVKKGFVLVKFAGPLKKMLRSIGLSEDEIEGQLKTTPCSLLGGKTPRFAMQTLGTEWGRNIIGEDFWLNLYAMQVNKFVNNVVTDDVRFQNEAELIRSMGGIIVELVYPPGIDTNKSSHVSEAGISNPDFVIVNDRSDEAYYTFMAAVNSKMGV